MNDLFYIANEEDRLKGFMEDGGMIKCLMCNHETEKGMIYPCGDLYMDASKAMEKHISEEHGSVFHHLVRLNKKTSGISEQQGKVLELFYEKMSDFDIQEELAIGSVSTVRNHRHILKEKEKQAKVFLTIMSLYSKVADTKQVKVKPHKSATMVDKRYDYTKSDAEKVLDKYFPDGLDGSLKTFHMKEKSKIIVLSHISKNFDLGRRYSQKEVDHILNGVYSDDYVLIRRYLIEYGFLDRTKDGKTYWVKDGKKDAKGKQEMNTKRKMLKEAYVLEKAEEKIVSGVYKIEHVDSGKVFIGTSRNIDNMNRILFQLRMGSFINRGLQKDWNEFGEDAFEISVLESFEEGEGNPNKVMREMERKWKEDLNPYGDNGYHRKL